MDKEFLLYNDTIRLRFGYDNHRYMVSEKQPDETWGPDDIKRGVTDTIKNVLHKPGLMLWPMDMALKHLQTNFHDTRLGTADGFKEMLEEAAKQHTKRSDAGKDTGTIVHEGINLFLTDKPKFREWSLAVDAEVFNGPMRAFMDWYLPQKAKVLKTEFPVFSRALNYAGTADMLLEIDGKIILADCKTTNVSRYGLKVNGQDTGIYPEAILQLGAYAKAYHEEETTRKEVGTLRPKKGAGWERTSSHTGEIELAENIEVVQPLLVDDLMVINTTKDGKVHTLRASELGLTVQDCEEAFEKAIYLDDWVKTIIKNNKETQ